MTMTSDTRLGLAWRFCHSALPQSLPQIRPPPLRLPASQRPPEFHVPTGCAASGPDTPNPRSAWAQRRQRQRETQGDGPTAWSKRLGRATARISTAPAGGELGSPPVRPAPPSSLLPVPGRERAGRRTRDLGPTPSPRHPPSMRPVEDGATDSDLAAPGHLHCAPRGVALCQLPCCCCCSLLADTTKSLQPYEQSYMLISGLLHQTERYCVRY
ncbi:hypothetical protein PVAP13_5NG352343 [Panicum virgatum]|uniref:Uncharacterized protein n=1 Tax=Panicum virgatum TaxID=38727 RepID=A0A8T0RRL3_PANVG|nr:hypothetical protein PVAP13_5NG352343 [Panicum virgatum]